MDGALKMDRSKKTPILVDSSAPCLVTKDWFRSCEGVLGLLQVAALLWHLREAPYLEGLSRGRNEMKSQCRHEKFMKCY